MADYAIHDTTLTDISNVIRKKEGSSALIDPAEYAERINLMGMLEYKIIVPSPICDFSDGSDDVPTDFVKIFIPANLNGKSSVSEVQTGRNLLNWSDFSDYSKWKTDISANQSYPTNGSYRGLLINLPIGTYTISFGISASSFPDYLYLCSDDGTASVRLINFAQGQTYYTNTGTFTVESGKIYFLRMGSMSTELLFNALIEKISWGQIERGSTAHSYEQYVDPKTYSANLGRTVYGGEVDIVNGTAEPLNLFATTRDYDGYSISRNGVTMSIESDGKIKFNGTTTSATDFSLYNASIAGNITLTIPKGTYTISNIGSNDVKMIVSGGGRNGFPYREITNGSYTGTVTDDTQPFNYFVFRFASGVTLDNVIVSVQIESGSAVSDYSPYFDPFSFDGQEIDTMLGYNCFISEDGDTSVAYRSSGTIYNYPTGEEASF